MGLFSSPEGTLKKAIKDLKAEGIEGVKRHLTANTLKNLNSLQSWTDHPLFDIITTAVAGNNNELLEESQVLLEEGKNDNRSGDRYGLVTVIYSLVLFLLGIVGIFKRLPNRRIVFYVSIGLLVLGTIFMLTIPLPTGFNFFEYFKG